LTENLDYYSSKEILEGLNVKVDILRIKYYLNLKKELKNEKQQIYDRIRNWGEAKIERCEKKNTCLQ